MRQCIYSNGDTLEIPGGVNLTCPNQIEDADGFLVDLVDYNDVVTVTTTPSNGLESLATLLTIGVLLVTLFGSSR